MARPACLMVLVIVLATSMAASAHPVAGRKLLQCLQLNNPSYDPRNGTTPLPLCSPQRRNGRWASSDDSANLAFSIHQDPSSNEIDDSMDCSGTVDQQQRVCWGGDNVYRGPTFSAVHCCVRTTGCSGAEAGCVGRRLRRSLQRA